ncbi:MAG: nucleoside hydrolase [Ilumatobacter coccineus]|uniref:Nucleoside hydrolase n=1 Tax=Ilumatobacter coccineus TaxID=467094 RepID=A0A2G6KEZ2_9ACTN|nr:MAG: nucleoside hydrolase [Ilumatobacter coccineus]
MVDPVRPHPDRRPIFIDTDTASDDAVALVIALRHPDIEVVGISVVAGNVPLDRAVQNALYTRDLCQAHEVPVHVGADTPLHIPLITAQNVHGADGMGDIGLDLSGRTPDSDDAVGALIQASHDHAGELTLVTLGPLTNIALALERDPDLPTRIDRVVTMGAVADHIGNVTPAAEYNMWADPDAVAAVLASDLTIEFVGWDISRKYAVITPEIARDIRSIGTPLAEFCVDIQAMLTNYCATDTKLAGFDLPDPITMAYAIDSTIATEIRDLYVEVETESELTRGMVVMDVLGITGQPPNARVITAADHDAFVDMWRRSVS